MEGNTQFTEKLEQALERYRVHLDQSVLPKIKTKFETYYGTYQNLYNVLMRKSMIKEDPYKEEHKISEIEPIADSEVAEMEKTDQIGLRLSKFDTQLSFLLNYYQFSVEFLTLSRIKLLAGLTKFINWENVAATSIHVNTRLLAELLGKVRGGSDTFSIQVLNNAQGQLASNGNDIVKALKGLTQYHRERYKLEVRKAVIEMLDMNPQSIVADKEPALAQIKKRFATSMQGMPYYGELISEILDEDYGVNNTASQNEVLKRLAITREQSKKKKQVDFRSILLESIRLLSASGKPVERAVAKLNESSNIIEEHRKRLDSPFRRWLYRVLGRGKDARVYNVEIIDPATAVAKDLEVDYDELSQKAAQTGRLITTYGGKTGPGFSRLNSMDEDSLYALLERNIKEIQNIVRLLPALQTYFQDEMDKDQRGKLRGIKLEINAIRNAIVKANQRRHEYVSRKEEQAQLKKLGIR